GWVEAGGLEQRIPVDRGPGFGALLRCVASAFLYYIVKVKQSIRSRRASVGHVAEHSSANRVPGAGAARLELPGQIEVDLVLQDFLDHDRQLVITTDLDQRASAFLQSLQSLLNQRGQLKATTHLVDNGFFLQFIQHFCPFELTVEPWRTIAQAKRRGSSQFTEVGRICQDFISTNSAQGKQSWEHLALASSRGST